MLKSRIRDLSDIKAVFLFFIIWLIYLFAVSLITHTIFLNQSFTTIFTSLASWDGGNFLEIADRGYNKESLTVFFPLYPLVISLVSKVLGVGSLFSAILINLISTYFSLLFLYKLIAREYTKSVAVKTLIFLLIFPFSFYLICVYSESLFLLTTVLSFYFFARNNLLLTLIASTLASLTRPVGFLIGTSLFYESIISKKPHALIYLISIAGVIGYSVYLLNTFGDPLLFIQSEKLWGRQLSLPGFGIWDSLYYLFKNGYDPQSFRILIELLFTVFGLGLILREFRRQRNQYVFYSLSCLIIPLITSTLLSLPRFLLVIFPIFVTIATIKSRIFLFIYSLSALILLTIFWVLFNLGHWVS